MRGRNKALDDAADRDLIARIGARDRQAFEQFYLLHARRVLAFVSEIIDTPDLAEEVASDAMIAVWNAAASFAGHARVTTWLLGIAHHKAVDGLRRRAGRPVVLDDTALEAARASPATDAFARVDDRLELDRALRALSTDHRIVLGLMFGFACSHAEIAAIVGCPVATVKTRVFYAKRRLRDELQRTGAAEELA